MQRLEYKIFRIFILFLVVSYNLFVPVQAQANMSAISDFINQNVKINSQIQNRDLAINYYPQDIVITRDSLPVAVTIVIRNRNPWYPFDNVFLKLDNEKYTRWFRGWPYGPWSLNPGEEKYFETVLAIPESEKEPEDLHEITISGEYAGFFRTPRTIRVQVLPSAQWYKDMDANINALPAEFRELGPGDRQSLDSIRIHLTNIIQAIKENGIPLNFSRIREFLNGSLSVMRGLTAAEQSFRLREFSETGQELDKAAQLLPGLQKYLEWEDRPEYKGPSKLIFSSMERLSDAMQKRHWSYVEITLVGEAEHFRQGALKEEDKAKEDGITLFERIAYYQKARDLYSRASELFPFSRKEINQNMSRTLREKAFLIERDTLNDIKSQISELLSSAGNSYEQAIAAKNQAAASRNLTLSKRLYDRAVELFYEAIRELQQIGDNRDSHRLNEMVDYVLEIEKTSAQVVEDIQSERDKATASDLEGDKNSTPSSQLKLAARLGAFKEAQVYYQEAMDSLNKAGSPEDIRKAETIFYKLADVKNRAESLDRYISDQRYAAQRYKEEAFKDRISAEKEVRLHSKRLLIVSAIAHRSSEIDIYKKLSDNPGDLNSIEEARLFINILQKEIADQDRQTEEISFQSAVELRNAGESLKLAKAVFLWPVARTNLEEARRHLVSASSYLNTIGEADKTEDYNRYSKDFPEVESILEIILISNMVILMIFSMAALFLSMRYFNLKSVRRERDLERSLFP